MHTLISPHRVSRMPWAHTMTTTNDTKTHKRNKCHTNISVGPGIKHRTFAWQLNTVTIRPLRHLNYADSVDVLESIVKNSRWRGWHAKYLYRLECGSSLRAYRMIAPPCTHRK